MIGEYRIYLLGGDSPSGQARIVAEQAGDRIAAASVQPAMI